MKRRLPEILKQMPEAWRDDVSKKRTILFCCAILFILICIMPVNSCRAHRDYEPMLMVSGYDNGILDEAATPVYPSSDVFERRDDVSGPADPLGFLNDPLQDSLREARRRKAMEAFGLSLSEDDSSQPRERDSLLLENIYWADGHEPANGFLDTVYAALSDRTVLVSVLAFGALGASLLIWMAMTLLLAPFRRLSGGCTPQPAAAEKMILGPWVEGYLFPLKYTLQAGNVSRYMVYDNNDRCVFTINPRVGKDSVERIVGLANGIRTDYVNVDMVKIDTTLYEILIGDIRLAFWIYVSDCLGNHSALGVLEYVVARLTNGEWKYGDEEDDDSHGGFRMVPVEDDPPTVPWKSRGDAGEENLFGGLDLKKDRSPLPSEGERNSEEMLLNEKSHAVFSREYGDLPADERILLYFLATLFERNGPGVSEDVDNDFPMTEEDRMALGGLIRRGLAIMITRDGGNSFNRVTKSVPAISPAVAGTLFHGLEKHLNMETSFSIYGALVRPESIPKKKLYYNDDVADGVKRLLGALSREHYPDIIGKMEQRGKRKAVTCMLYGPPGTGKTELVMQAAKKSRRDVFKVEYSKLMDTYVSETEHNLKNVFLLYRYAAAVLSTPPILLLNEADTFISTRVSVRQANDKFENEFQGMFLEELEQFEGILVATTNRTQDIDDAYDRRFLIKMKIDSPDGKTRFSIWKNRMPELKKGEAQALSEKYRLTGAEIENVITQFDVMSAIDDTPPGIADLEKICAGVEAGTIGQKRQPAGYKIS